MGEAIAELLAGRRKERRSDVLDGRSRGAIGVGACADLPPWRSRGRRLRQEQGEGAVMETPSLLLEVGEGQDSGREVPRRHGWEREEIPTGRRWKKGAGGLLVA
jgi:hypothetical protein